MGDVKAKKILLKVRELRWQWWRGDKAAPVRLGC
jgi:hypothetical protein